MGIKRPDLLQLRMRRKRFLKKLRWSPFQEGIEPATPGSGIAFKLNI
jgi:hypothetical protein